MLLLLVHITLAVKLADDTVSRLAAKFTKVKRKVMDLDVPTTLIARPSANKILLGIDPITDAKLIQDCIQLKWDFADPLVAKHHLYFLSEEETMLKENNCFILVKCLKIFSF